MVEFYCEDVFSTARVNGSSRWNYDGSPRDLTLFKVVDFDRLRQKCLHLVVHIRNRPPLKLQSF